MRRRVLLALTYPLRRALADTDPPRRLRTVDDVGHLQIVRGERAARARLYPRRDVIGTPTGRGRKGGAR